jgi:DNA-directed RNA polymerase subunit RPC12/RpoP
MSNIDHQFTDEVVCPYCGYESKDSWKFGDSNMSEIGGLECVQCERGFLYTRNLRVTYSISKTGE